MTKFVRCLRRAPLSLAVAAAAAGWALPVAAQDLTRGAELWGALECSECHGAGAGGMMGPALAGTELSLDRVRTQVRTGGGMMPAFTAEDLSESDLEAVYEWLLSLEPATLGDKRTWWGTDLVNLPTPRTPRRGELEVHFTHRFSESIADAGRQRLWGLDSFAFPGVWFLWGLTDRVAAYAGRTANLATWEAGGKVELAREGDLAEALSVGLQAGLTFLDTDGIGNDTRFTVELPVGVRASDRLALAVTPLWVSNPDEQDRSESEGHALALGLGGSLKLSRGTSLDGEWITHLGGFERPGAGNQWQAGVTFDVGGHLFQLLLTNNIQTTPDFMAGGALPTGIDSELRFGFNLVRSFGS